MTARRRRCRTGKADWRTEEQAREALSVIQHKGEQRADTPIRAYLCPYCHRWHLTSREEKPLPAEVIARFDALGIPHG